MRHWQQFSHQIFKCSHARLQDRQALPCSLCCRAEYFWVFLALEDSSKNCPYLQRLTHYFYCDYSKLARSLPMQIWPYPRGLCLLGFLSKLNSASWEALAILRFLEVVHWLLKVEDSIEAQNEKFSCAQLYLVALNSIIAAKARQSGPTQIDFSLRRFALDCLTGWSSCLGLSFHPKSCASSQYLAIEQKAVRHLLVRSQTSYSSNQ